MSRTSIPFRFRMNEPLSSLATRTGRPGTTGTPVPTVPEWRGWDMRKSNGAARGEDDALYQLVRKHVAEFRGTNGGVEPTRAQVAVALGRRKADVCGAMNRLEEAEATDAARLAALPDLPERVRSAGAELIGQIWVAANESAAVAVGELRRHIADAGHRHDRQMAATTSLLAEIEAELERMIERTGTAEADLVAAREENARLTDELSRATAKLEDRATLFALMRGTAYPRGSEHSPAASDAPAPADMTDGGTGAVGDVVEEHAEPKAGNAPRRAKEQLAERAGGTGKAGTAPDTGGKDDPDEPRAAYLPGINPRASSPADDPSG